jgi:hypothetical protein
VKSGLDWRGQQQSGRLTRPIALTGSPGSAQSDGQIGGHQAAGGHTPAPVGAVAAGQQPPDTQAGGCRQGRPGQPGGGSRLNAATSAVAQGQSWSKRNRCRRAWRTRRATADTARSWARRGPARRPAAVPAPSTPGSGRPRPGSARRRWRRSRRRADCAGRWPWRSGCGPPPGRGRGGPTPGQRWDCWLARLVAWGGAAAGGGARPGRRDRGRAGW